MLRSPEKWQPSTGPRNYQPSTCNPKVCSLHPAWPDGFMVREGAGVEGGVRSESQDITAQRLAVAVQQVYSLVQLSAAQKPRRWGTCKSTDYQHVLRTCSNLHLLVPPPASRRLSIRHPSPVPRVCTQCWFSCLTLAGASARGCWRQCWALAQVSESIRTFHRIRNQSRDSAEATNFTTCVPKRRPPLPTRTIRSLNLDGVRILEKLSLPCSGPLLGDAKDPSGLVCRECDVHRDWVGMIPWISKDIPRHDSLVLLGLEGTLPTSSLRHQDILRCWAPKPKL